MPDGLYDADILIWADTQADLLRRLAAGERVNAAIDWPNVIEEVQDVGRSELNAFTSHIRQALIHLLKLRAWPQSRSVPHWRSEIIGFLADAEQEFSPSMRQRVDLEKVYGRALMSVQAASDESGTPLPLPGVCPYTLDILLSADLSALGGNG